MSIKVRRAHFTRDGLELRGSCRGGFSEIGSTPVAGAQCPYCQCFCTGAAGRKL